MGQIRVFFAIDIPQETKNDIARLQQHVSAKLDNSYIRWIPVRNLHITLKFVGDTTHENIHGLKQTIHSIAGSNSSMGLTPKDVASFPSLKQPRVLVVRIQSSPELEALHQEIESVCQTLGYPKEAKSFHPHLTIARIKDKASKKEKELIGSVISEAKVDLPGTFTVDSVHLYKSELQSTGAEYEKLYSALLSAR